jgi:hypothetical protein
MGAARRLQCDGVHGPVAAKKTLNTQHLNFLLPALVNFLNTFVPCN